MNRHRWLLVAALSAVASTSPAIPQGFSQSATFVEVGEYELASGGQNVGARFFVTNPAGIVLIDAPSIDGIVELNPRGLAQSLFLRSDYIHDQNGTRRRAANATPAITEKFTVITGDPLFSVDKREYRMGQREALVGPASRAKLLQHDPTYGIRSQLSRLDPTHLEALRSVAEPIRVQVFFGSWCSHCREMLPNILRLEESLKGSKVTFEYYGLPEGLADPVSVKFKVTSVPTGLVWQGNTEIGRAQSFSWRTADLALRTILIKAGILKP